jgi:hypothetical protein
MAIHIRRRELLVTLGGAAAWALAARAQQGGKIPTVGYLWHAGSPQEEVPYFGALLEGFGRLGYIDGRNIKLEHRFPNEMPERFKAMAAELVSLNVDVLMGGAVASPYRPVEWFKYNRQDQDSGIGIGRGAPTGTDPKLLRRPACRTGMEMCEVGILRQIEAAVDARLASSGGHDGSRPHQSRGESFRCLCGGHVRVAELCARKSSASRKRRESSRPSSR